MQKQKSSNSEELYGELGRAFNFTRGDLEANRLGFVSKRQKQAQWKNVRVVLSVLLILGIMFYAIFAGLEMFESDAEQSARGFWAVTFLVSIMLSSLLLLLVPVIRDIDFGKVQQLVRHVQAKKRYVYRAGDRMFLIAGADVFGLPHEAESFQWKSTVAYRIFFLPKSKTILSIEEVSPEEG